MFMSLFCHISYSWFVKRNILCFDRRLQRPSPSCISLDSPKSLLMTQIALHSVSGGGNEICNGTAGPSEMCVPAAAIDLELLNQNNTSQTLPYGVC